MTIVGFHASHEQLPPSRLLHAVQQAEEAGFDAAMCSDHLEPWSVRQGHSGYAWSWLGAALEATRFSLGVVTAPGQRYHPAVAAQKIATLGEMFPGRFWAAIGSGEAVNEHVTGELWPEKEERDARLVETIDVMRRLLAGEEVSADGLVRVDRARIWSLPDVTPPLLAAAVSTETAREAAAWADGIITIEQSPDLLREVMDAYREAGGLGPIAVQAHLSWAPTDDEAVAIAHDRAPPPQGGAGLKITDRSDLWWKNAVVYCLDIETFMDWNDDGYGDFEGLAHRLDHLAELGVTCIWLMRFQPTPDRDDGYDITDFYGVDPRLGSLGDVAELTRTARDRGMRVIIDFVMNHTSDRHPWFKSARRSRTAPFRDCYVWVDEPPKQQAQTVFPGEEENVWELDERTGQYYLHSFYRHQPDLNIANPAVRNEIAKTIGFWLELGISGFRVDAVPFLIEAPQGVDLGDPHEILRDLRRFLQRRSSEAVMLGEVNLPFEQQLDYFGRPGQAPELTMQFDFLGMQALYLSLAREDARPLAASLAKRPQLEPEAQWANFVRNHDELTLDKLSESEREEVFTAFAPEEWMRVYGRGIVRRLPPMLDGDPRRIRMVYSLLFSLPGTPVLFYGEEIGMGENGEQPGRQAVRTPMQWTDEANGGFSRAPLRRLTAKPPTDGYAPEHINVEAQMHDPDSLLAFIRELAVRYRGSPEIGWGVPEVLETGQDPVLAHRITADVGRFVAVHNFAPRPTVVSLELGAVASGTVFSDLFAIDTFPLDESGRIDVHLDAYGYRWFRVVEPDDRRLT